MTKRINRRAFEADWNNRRLTLEQIGARHGCSRRSASRFGAAFGLAPRHCGHQLTYDDALFHALYAAGVSLTEIAGLFGIGKPALVERSHRLGLPRRGRGWHPVMTLAQWREAQVGAAMAQGAAETRAALAARRREEREWLRVAA